MLRIELVKSVSEKESLVLIVNKNSDLKEYLKKAELVNYVKKKLEAEVAIVQLSELYREIFFVNELIATDPAIKKEKYRRAGSELSNLIKQEKIKTIQIKNLLDNDEVTLCLVEGLALSNYQFLKYKTDKKNNTLSVVQVLGTKLNKQDITELSNIIEATALTRDLVNEPVIYLTAEQFSKEIQKIGDAAAFKVEIFNKAKIKSLKMGGLLAVNMGSPNPPTFNILEYKPANAKNKKPYILVGKGVVYDTGGLSLKPTLNSMDMMKCDMAGGAAVTGTLYAIAKNKLPIYVIGLIPATENRPDGNAVTPGDVITMFDGTTVEVLNTDAEGRLILADALRYASKYNPELVIDLATLTGSAVAAIGKEGSVMMGNVSEEIKNKFKNSGNEVHERLVEFPLWDEYGKQLDSDIADMKNIGSGEGGAITAGKFLEKFVDYPWIHLDIAGPAFLKANDYYRGKGGTGVGVRLLYHFLKHVVNEVGNSQQAKGNRD